MNTIDQPIQQGKIRRSAAQWQQIIDAYPGSGLTQVQYCRQHGIGVSSFHKWKVKLQAKPQAIARQDDFVALPLSLPTQCEPWRIELDLGDGAVLRIR